MTTPRLRPLIPQDEIAQLLRRLAWELRRDYLGEDLVVIGILKGAFIFMADLVRMLDLPLQVDFVRAASYGGGVRPTTAPRFLLRPHLPLAGRHLLVVEDIVDTGRTTSAVLRYLARRRPASMRLCALLSKPSRREVPVVINYLGATIPDLFVVGYGLDAAEEHRNLPYIAYLENESTDYTDSRR